MLNSTEIIYFRFLKMVKLRRNSIFSYYLPISYQKRYLVIAIICTALYVILCTTYTPDLIERILNYNYNEDDDDDGLIINTTGCKLKKTNIMPRFYKERWHRRLWNKVRTPKCGYEKQLIIIQHEKTLKLTKTAAEDFKNGDCCFYEIKRKYWNSDRGFSLSNCIPLNMSTSIDVSNTPMFVTKCGDSLNFDTAIPLTKKVQQKSDYWKNHPDKDKQISVLHIGFDTVSRSHAYRSLPLTIDYMMSQMDFIDFQGYHSAADSTLPNFMSFLMGLQQREVRLKCAKNWRTPFDTCPFIWKDFSANNYITMYLEDGNQSFNWGHQSGFNYVPTDYYYHPIFTAVQSLRQHHPKEFNERVHKDHYVSCASNETIPQFVARLTKRFCTKFAGQPFYAFTYFNDPFHGNIYSLANFDTEALALFKHLNSLPELLENTLIIFNSDHGDRTTFFQSISNSITAFIERALPPLFIRIPRKLKVLYPELEGILKENAAKKLVSPFDLHHTLKHLIHLSRNTKRRNNNTNTESNTQNNANKLVEEEFKPATESRSSLFLPLSNNRTCKDLFVSTEACACDVGIGSSITKEITYSNTLLEKVLECVQNSLNGIIENSKYKNDCSKWSTIGKSIKTKHPLRNTKEYLNLLIQFVANPGKAEFQAKVRIYLSLENEFNSCEILGEFNRVSLYGNQSHCIEFVTDEDKKMKELCFCK